MAEDLNGALLDCISACGGSKTVAAALWPEKTPDAAQRQLLACMNDTRPEKLSPDQVLFVLRLARRAGHHGGMEYICAELGYATPTPTDPRDEVADLMRCFNESVARQAAIAERIEKVADRLAMGGRAQ